MREQMRDKSRDDLAYLLNSTGLKAEMADRGRPEEKIDNSWYQRSLGIIDISEGPVRWINILKRDRSKDSPPKWWVVMGIPDNVGMPGSKEIKIKTVRKKAFPFFGKVVDVIWKGDVGSTGLIDTLSIDQDVKSLSERLGNIEIKSYFSSGQCDSCAKERTGDASVCVSCGEDLGFQGWAVIFDRRITVLSNTDWGVIEKIADYILRCPRTV
jgi:hypothetical protein